MHATPQPSGISLEAKLETVSLPETKSTTQAKKHLRKLRRKSPQPSTAEHKTSEDTAAATTVPASLSTTDLVSMATPIRLLICSIGNPAPYSNTFHSAGHIVLSALAASMSYPSFQKDSSYGNGVVSSGLEMTLWQSKSYMNVSGTGVLAAWRQFQKETRGQNASLVVVHDELELGIGDVKVRDGGASAKGHNGLKDIAKCLNNQQYKRIGVGIGRPQSREPNVVADYVLKKINSAEKAKIEGAWTRVEAELRRMQGI